MLGRWRRLALVPLLVCVGSAAADEAYDKLARAYDDAQQKWFQKEVEKSGAFDWKEHPVGEFMPKFRKLAEQRAGKSDAAKPLVWIIRESSTLERTGNDQAEKVRSWAMKTLREDLAGDPVLKESLSDLKYVGDIVTVEALVDFYEAILKKNSDKGVKAQATFNLAYALNSEFAPRDDPSPKRVAAQQERAKSLFRKFKEEYAGTAAAKDAEPYVFEIERLQVGMKAPGIVGKRLDDSEIKLSQFRGQVVVLDFWGFW